MHVRVQRTFEYHAEDDHALLVTDAAHLELARLQVFGGGDRRPDVMLALAHVIILPLYARVAFQCHRAECPHSLFGRIQGEMARRNQLPENRADLHGRSFVILLFQYLEVTGVDAAALLEEIAYGEGPFVVYNATSTVYELLAEL